jgi:hypothetical protein
MQPMQGMMPNQAAQPTQFQYAQGQDPSAPAQMMTPGMAPGMAPGMPQGIPQGIPQGMAPGAVPGNPAVPNGGMLYITAPAAEPEQTENTGNGEPPADPRIYRPRVTKKNKTYTATVRPLPNGTNFASYPYVCVKYHYIRDLVTGKLLIAKCCQNPTKTPDGKIIPGVDKFSCPFCQDVWNRRKAAKEAGADENTLKKYLQMLPEDVWYGNALIISDENHNDLAGQVKLWEMNKFQHNTLQEPVTEFNKRAEAIKEGKQYFDKGNCFIPYDPVQGRNYQIVGVWDEKKTMGTGKKGAPTYKDSGFAGYSSMLATKNVTNPQTGMQEVVFDENQMYDILQRCYDLSIVYEDTPTPEQARATLAKFWQEVQAEIAQKQQSAAAGNFGLGAPQAPGAPSPYNQTYAAQPFQTGVPGYMPQGSIPNVPPTTKVQTGLSFGQVPNTPATTAYSPTPAVMQTPVNPSQPGNIQPAQFAQPTAPAAAPAAPTFAASTPAPAQAAPQFAPQGVQMNAPAAAPAAPQFTAPTAAQFAPQGVQMGAPAAAPAAEPYRPAPAPATAPATPAFQVPSQGASPSAPVQQQAAPAQQQVPTYETDDDETLPF